MAPGPAPGPAPGEAWAWFAAGPQDTQAAARVPGLLATRLAEVTDDPGALDRPGFWAVVAGFEGGLLCARFADVRRAPAPAPPPDRTHGTWVGPDPAAWRSSLDRHAYLAAVAAAREHIAAGTVYQVNVCRILEAPMPDPGRSDVRALHARLATANPAPYAAVVHLPGHGVRLVSASPELFLRRDGDVVESGPIKGTGRVPADLRTKDVAENVMITDLVRNDLGRVAVTGSVTVPALCTVEPHPGLVHLVSRVRCSLMPGAGWGDLLSATLPPGSVSGAPKSSALRIIGELEPVPRGPYCGAVGWVSDRTAAVLAVGIRTFWLTSATGSEVLRFGTGAGIVWDSDPAAEWAETELKASLLVSLASQAPGPVRSGS